jgi:hypothetical protein
MNILEKIQEVNNQKTTFITPENLAPNVSVFGITSNMNNLGDLNIAPNHESIDYDAGYVNSVHVEGVTNSYIKDLEPNLTPDNIALDATIYGVVGTYTGSGGIQINDYFITDISQNDASEKSYKFTDLMVKAPPLSTEYMYNAYSMFANTGSITSVSELDTANLVNAGRMFFNSVKLEQVPNFDYNNVTDASYMFQNCYSLVDLNMSNFDKVVTLRGAFENCGNIKSVNIGNFNGCATMVDMFNNCGNLTAVNVGKLSKGAFTTDMFNNCRNLASVNIGELNYGVNAYYMFVNCRNLTNVSIPNDYYINNYNGMYANCVKLNHIDDIHIGVLNAVDTSIYNKPEANIDLHFNLAFYNGAEGNWNQSVIDNVDGYINNYYLGYGGYWGWTMANSILCNMNIYNDATNSIFIYANKAYANGISNAFGNMFDYCESITQLPNFIQPEKIDNDPVRYLNISYTVYNAYANNTNPFNGNYYNNFAGGIFNYKFAIPAFKGCKSLTSVGNIFNTEGMVVYSMYNMFYECQNLTELPNFLKSTVTYNNVEFDYIDTAPYMFYNCVNMDFSNLPNFFNGNTWETFSYCPITEINYLTAGSTYYAQVNNGFSHCENLQYINHIIPTYANMINIADFLIQLNTNLNLSNLYNDRYDNCGNGVLAVDQNNANYNIEPDRYLVSHLSNLTINDLDLHVGVVNRQKLSDFDYDYNANRSEYDYSSGGNNLPVIFPNFGLAYNTNEVHIGNLNLQSYTSAEYSYYSYDYWGGSSGDNGTKVNHLDYDPSRVFYNVNVVDINIVNLSSYGRANSSSNTESDNSKFGVYIPLAPFKNISTLQAVNQLIINSYGTGRAVFNAWYTGYSIWNESNQHMNTASNNIYADEYSSIYPFVDLNFTNYFANCQNLSTIGSIDINLNEYTNIQKATCTAYSYNHFYPNNYALPMNNTRIASCLKIDNMLANCSNLTVDSINNVLTFFNNIASSYSGYDSIYGFKQLGLTQDQYNNISGLAVVSSLKSKGWNTNY